MHKIDRESMNVSNALSSQLRRLIIPAARISKEHADVVTRLAWFGLVGLIAVLFSAGVPVIIDQMEIVCTAADTCLQWQAAPADFATLHRFGLSPHSWGVSFVVLDSLLLLTFVTVATVLFWRRRGDRMAVFCSFMLLLLGASFTQTIRAAGSNGMLWWLPVHLLQFLSLTLLIIFFYVFPNGRFVPSWTRRLSILSVAVSAFIAFTPGEQSVSTAIAILVLCLGIASLLGTAAFAQVYRYRHASGVTERLQTKWPVAGFTATLLSFAGLVVLFAVYVGRPASLPPPLRDTAFLLLAYNAWRIPFVFIPLTVGVAALRYRLFDIDVIISRTLVYGGLTAVVIAFYVLVVGSVGVLFRTGDNLVISLLATGFVAVFFQPLREGLQRRVNHLMYGERDNPYQVLSRLSRRLGETLAPETLLYTIAETTRQALKLPYAAITVRKGDDLVVAASSGTSVGDPFVFPLIYQHEPVGELLVARRGPGEDFGPADKRLLHDLVGQAGIAVHAARLTSDLRLSRERLVTAREEERRRVRRDLHDGLGPTLASLSQRLDLVGALVHRDPEAATALLGDLKTQVGGTIADIRRLVYALRPLTLDAHGVVGAIREHALQFNRSNGIRVSVLAPDPFPPLSAAVEVAAYRIALEALTNVVRHANSMTCKIQLVVDGELRVEIVDDGDGLPVAWKAGVGMSSMRERADELGGRCTVEPAQGGGTRVLAVLPLVQE